MSSKSSEAYSIQYEDTHKARAINKEQKYRTSRLMAFKITRAYLNDYHPLYPYIAI